MTPVFRYNNQTEEAGREFLDELDRAVRLVKSYPHALTEIEQENRRCLLAHFPYALI